MDTEILHTDARATGKSPVDGSAEGSRELAEVCKKATDVLTGGGLVAFPTETVYGVAASVGNRQALDRLRSLKSRGPGKAFTIHIGSPDAADGFAPDLPGLAKRFIRKAWPGPLTLVVPVDDPTSAPAMAGLNGSAAATVYFENTVGLRCPDDPVAQAVLQGVKAPVVAASANLAGEAPPHSGQDVLKSLDGKIELLIDTGRTKYAKPSTIVRVTGPSYELVREGVYDAGMVQRLSALRVLFVCTGNTCRSPMAVGLAKKMIAERWQCDVADLPSRGVVVESAGTLGGTGGVSPHAVTAMTRRGIDVSDHVSSALSPDLIQQADHVFAMTQSHVDAIVRMVPSAEDRVASLLEDEDVQDPMGSGEDGYERSAKMIEAGVRSRLQEVNL